MDINLPSCTITSEGTAPSLHQRFPCLLLFPLHQYLFYVSIQWLFLEISLKYNPVWGYYEPFH